MPGPAPPGLEQLLARTVANPVCPQLYPYPRPLPPARRLLLRVLQFGPGPIQQHGFARNVDWEIAATSADPQPDDRDPEVQLVLTDTDFTRAMWCAGAGAGGVGMGRCMLQWS